MRTIPLSHNKEAIVDDEDYDRVAALIPWSFCNTYASRYTPGSRTARKRFYMHHFILGVTPDLMTVVDHINGNRLDNRKSNLRTATRQLNATNSKMNTRNKSGYKGVTFYPRNRNPARQWRAMYANKHLGYFSTPELANECYQAYVKMIGL